MLSLNSDAGALGREDERLLPGDPGKLIGKVEQLFVMPSAVDPRAEAYEIIVPELSGVGLLRCFHLCVEHFCEDLATFSVFM